MATTTRVEEGVPSFDEEAAVDLVLRMMAIPGPSCQEGEVVAFITAELERAGVDAAAIDVDGAARRSPRGGETGNLVLKLPGTIRGPRRLLMAHVDTVPLCVGAQPVRNGESVHSKDPTTALGGDDRAGASAILTAVLEIRRQGLPHPPLTVLWPVQEEIGLLGARFVGKSKLGNPKLCFNWDGSSPHTICIGATGDYAIEIDVHGVASHAGAAPDSGVNAIVVASLAIADLQRNGWHGRISKGGKTGTSNVGIVEGGSATNVVTPFVTLRAEARSHDARFRKRIVREIREAFTRAVKQVKSVDGRTGRVDFRADLKYESFVLKRNEPAVRTAEQAVRLAGLEPALGIGDGGLDANWMVEHGFPTVTLGCGQEAIHTVDERLSIPRYLEACRIALSIASGRA